MLNLLGCNKENFVKLKQMNYKTYEKIKIYFLNIRLVRKPIKQIKKALI